MRRGRRPGNRKRRRVFKRKGNRKRQNHLMVARKVRVGTWVWSSASTDGFWRYETCDLALLPNASDFLNTFEEYKVCRVKFQYIPSYDSQSAGDAANTASALSSNAYQMMIAAEPRTSITTPTGTYSVITYNTFLAECNRAKTVRGGRVGSVYYKPTVADEIGTTANTRYYNAPWIRTTISNITHRGHHVFVWGLNGGDLSGLRFEVYATLYVKFRGMR